MISSKNFLIHSLLCLVACSSPKKENTEAADSTKTDSIANVTIASDDEDKGGSTFDIDPSLSGQSLTIYGQSGPIIYWLNKIYRPDHWINLDTGTANYMIRSADLTEEEFSNKDGKCVKRSVLLTQREMPGEQYYDVHFIYEDADGKISSEKVSYDGDIAQSTGSVSLSTDYRLSNNCPVLAVISLSEGGDIDFGRSKEISLFIATETGMMQVFSLVQEHLIAHEYEVTGDENKNSESETRDFKILDTKSNGLFDIKVHTIIKKDGEVTEEKDSVFRFNGQKYSE